MHMMISRFLAAIWSEEAHIIPRILRLLIEFVALEHLFYWHFIEIGITLLKCSFLKYKQHILNTSKNNNNNKNKWRSLV